VAALKTSAWSLLGYLLVVCMLTYPMILSPSSVVIGHEYASVACHIWVLWWAREHLGEFDTDLIFYPYGSDVVQLYGSDILSPPLLAQLPFSLAVLYNFWVIVLLLVGAMGARRLALYFKHTEKPAFLAGIIFCSAPFFQHEMLNGTSELLSTGFLPWYAWLFLSMLEKPSIGKSLSIGLVAGILLTLSAYNPFFILLLSLVFLLFRLTRSIKPTLTLQLWTQSIWAGLVFLPFALGIGFLQLNHGAAETFSRRTNWLDKDLLLPDSYASILNWFDPRESAIPAVMDLPSGGVFEYWTTCTVYLGWIVIFGILWGWRQAKQTDLRMLQWLLVLAMLIAMGPYLRFDKEVLSLFGYTIYLPSYTIGYLFPLFAVTAIHAYRYTAVVILAASILASKHLKSLLWGGLILLEVLLWAPQMYPTPVTQMLESQVLDYLAEQPDGAVFTYPIAGEDLHDLGQVLLAQTVHGKPIHDGGIHGRAGSEATQLFRDNFMVDQLSNRLNVEYPTGKEAQVGFQHLYEQGYRYVLSFSEEAEALEWGTSVLGEPMRKDEKWVVWILKDKSN
jgi:hypothetical protein